MQPKLTLPENRIDGLGFEATKEYDDAMFNWLSGIGKFLAGKSSQTIKVVMATPEKAFAKTVSPLNEGQPDIPMISFYMTGIALDKAKRGMVPSHILIQKWRESNLEWARAPVDLPVVLNYTATLWAKHRYEVRYVLWSIMTRFSPNSFVEANGTVSPIYLDSVSDTSELEPGADDDRKVRCDFSFKIEGWLPMAYTVAFQLEKINIGLTDADESALTEGDGVGANLNNAMFPEMTLKEGQGAVIVQTAMRGVDEPYNSPTGGTSVPNQNASYHAIGYSPTVGSIESSIPNAFPFGGEPLVYPVPKGSEYSIVFLRENDPHWNVSQASALRVWQLTNAPPAIFGEVYLTRRIETVDGIEYSGVLGSGFFQYPYLITANGSTFFEARRWSRFEKEAN